MSGKPERLPGDSRAYPVLGERIARLKTLHELRAPANILAIETMLVFKAMFANFPEQMGFAFAQWASPVALGEIGLCPMCSSDMPHELHLCDACLKAEEGEDDE